MRVLVTGGSGRLGRGVVTELVEHGHTVVNADQRRPANGTIEGERFVQTDLLDVGQVAGALKGCDALIHLGAIPAPYSHADEFVFRNNTIATFTAFQAAALLDVKRVAFASSCSGYGMAWTKKPFGPYYVPLDEEHPFLPAECYGLSKEVDERTGEMFHRQTGMSVVALRFHWIAQPEELAAIAAGEERDPSRIPGNLWAHVDVRDAAAACRLAIEQSHLGFEAFNIVGPDTTQTTPTEELIRKYLPETEIRKPIPGRASAWSIEKAERLLGWKPRYSCRPSE
jgi:nucleoside-diphosphate-sugar epimerase